MKVYVKTGIEVQDDSIFKAGNLVVSPEDGQVVMSLGQTDDFTFAGVALNKPGKRGPEPFDYRPVLAKECFIRFDGMVTLEND